VVLIAFWNPWTAYVTSRLSKAEATGETTQDALRGQIEASSGQADVEAAAQEVRVIVQTVREATHAVEIEARAAPGADDPIDPDTFDRLHANDRRLCDIGSVVCSDGSGGPAPGPDAAG